MEELLVRTPREALEDVEIIELDPRFDMAIDVLGLVPAAHTTCTDGSCPGGNDGSCTNTTCPGGQHGSCNDGTCFAH